VPVTELDTRFSAPGAVATPWPTVERLLEEAELFWLSTVRATGAPHVTPLPAVWIFGALHFSTGAGEQKAVNLARANSVVLTTGTNVWKSGLDVVVEGRAERVTDQQRLHELADAWARKYNGEWDFEVVDDTFEHHGGKALVFGVVPTKVLSFAKGDFAQTRYRF
jgi:nitroimidazol reductase NimA-like FMN-containing flavoprotein (pyridoxamine 5'-phosphate oxidase superfamily)